MPCLRGGCLSSLLPKLSRLPARLITESSIVRFFAFDEHLAIALPLLRENEVRLVDLDALCLRFYGWMNPGLRGRILALPQIFQQVIVDQLGERTGVPSYCGIDDRLLRKQPSRDGLTRGLANLAQEHRLRVLPSRWGGVFPLRLHSLNFFSRIGTERLPTFLNLSTRDVSQDLSGVPLLTGPAIHYKSHHDISDIHEGPLRPER